MNCVDGEGLPLNNNSAWCRASLIEESNASHLCFRRAVRWKGTNCDGDFIVCGPPTTFKDAERWSGSGAERVERLEDDGLVRERYDDSLEEDGEPIERVFSVCKEESEFVEVTWGDSRERAEGEGDMIGLPDPGTEIEDLSRWEEAVDGRERPLEEESVTFAERTVAFGRLCNLFGVFFASEMLPCSSTSARNSPFGKKTSRSKQVPSGAEDFFSSFVFGDSWPAPSASTVAGASPMARPMLQMFVVWPLAGALLVWYTDRVGPKLGRKALGPSGPTFETVERGGTLPEAKEHQHRVSMVKKHKNCTKQGTALTWKVWMQMLLAAILAPDSVLHLPSFQYLVVSLFGLHEISASFVNDSSKKIRLKTPPGFQSAQESRSRDAPSACMLRPIQYYQKNVDHSIQKYPVKNKYSVV